MRCISSISLLVVFSLVLAGGCQQSVEVTRDEPVVADTPDNETMAEQIEQERVDTQQSAPQPDQMQTQQPEPQSDQMQVEQPLEVEATPVETVTEEVEASTEAEASQAETEKETEGPSLRFEKVVHDYGDIGAGTKHKAEFPFKNVGTSVLNITGVERTCGCTVPALEKKTYAPGESGVIVVEFHSDPRPGKPRKMLNVVSNDPENPRIALTIKANVVQRVNSEPERLKFFLGDDNAGIREITLTSEDGLPFSIKSFKATGDTITADFDPSVEATKFVLKAKVDAEKLKTNQRGHIGIALTHPECPAVNIYFDVLAKYTVNPPMIIIFEAVPSKPVNRKVWVLSNYKQPFDVDSIVTKGDSIKQLGKKEIRNGYELMLELVPPDPKGESNYNGGFSIKLTDGSELPIEYRVFYAEPESEDDESNANANP